MKKSNRASGAFKFLLGVLLTSFWASDVVAQEKEAKSSNFSITVEAVGEKINLKCEEGCSWETLSFSNNGRKHSIDIYGVVVLTEKTYIRETSEALNFIFTLEKVKGELRLKGEKGTVWTDLSFKLNANSNYGLDEYGITKLN